MILDDASGLNGYRSICGVDEAGRGPLAGPVFAACVILDPARKIDGLADSKKISAKKRASLTMLIKEYARAWAVSSASVLEIERLNILRASLLAMKRAVENLAIAPDMILVDGNFAPQLNKPVRTIIKGDSFIPEISAASILAKTARDTEMLAVHQRFPLYGFDQHKGYPTKKHIAALQMHGASPVHRQNFAPVKAVINAASASPFFLPLV